MIVENSDRDLQVLAACGVEQPTGNFALHILEDVRERKLLDDTGLGGKDRKVLGQSEVIRHVFGRNVTVKTYPIESR
jgi:hypothetical protein